MAFEKPRNLAIPGIVLCLLLFGGKAPTLGETHDRLDDSEFEEEELRDFIRDCPHGETVKPLSQRIEALSVQRPGAAVTLFFQATCQEPHREVRDFLHLIDNQKGDVPFSTSFIGVDIDRTRSMKLLIDKHVFSFPTFVVSREDREIGRIVKQSPRGLKRDLELLIDGASTGLVSANERVIRQYLSLETRIKSACGTSVPEVIRSPSPAKRSIPAINTDAPGSARPVQPVVKRGSHGLTPFSDSLYGSP